MCRVVWNFLPFKHCCLFRNLCLYAEGSDAEQPWIPRAVHSSQQGFRQQYPSRLVGFAWRSKNSCTCKPLQKSLCLNTMMPTFFLRAVPALPMQKTVSFSFKTENNAATKQRNPAIILSRQVLWRWDKVLLTKCSFTDISSAIESEDQLLSLAFHSARCCF